MKESQFKTGGRRLRIEDLQAIQDNALKAIEFMRVANRNFVVNGCDITIISQTSSGITVSVSSGLAYIGGKLRPVAAVSSILIPSTGTQELLIAPEDITTGNEITYFDGTTGQQFYIYQANVLIGAASSYLNSIKLQKPVDFNSTEEQVLKFHDFRSAFLGTMTMMLSGGKFDPDALLTFHSEDNANRNEIDQYAVAVSEQIDDVVLGAILSAQGLEITEDEYSASMNARDLSIKNIIFSQFKNTYTGEWRSVSDILTKQGFELDADAAIELVSSISSGQTRKAKLAPEGIKFSINNAQVSEIGVQGVISNYIRANQHFQVGTQIGLTQDITIDGKVLSFQGGILVGVFNAQ